MQKIASLLYSLSPSLAQGHEVEALRGRKVGFCSVLATVLLNLDMA